MPEDQKTRKRIDSIADDILSLFRDQPDYNSISFWESEIVRRVGYASAVAQSEKVTPPEGWDPLGR